MTCVPRTYYLTMCVLFQVQDAQATMRLYTMYRKQWESELGKKKNKQKGKKAKT